MAPFDSVTARLILLLAETGSIGRAAEREGIASSAVSRRVSDLEGRLGVVLFDRSAQGVKLTSAGEAYAAGCRIVLRAIAGTSAGYWVLQRLTDANFKRWTRLIVTAIGIYYLIRGLTLLN